MIYIIADDLTGANDAGVQLSKQGYKTMVLIPDEDHEINESNQEENHVLVIDTETRESDTPSARRKIRNIMKKLPIKETDIVYKKIDSTLRGNIGAEIEDMLELLQKDICILAPSFPSIKRINVGGYLIVQGEPLGDSEYYNGPLGPGEASFIPSLLESQTHIPVTLIDLKEVYEGEEAILNSINNHYQKGKRIILFDAVKEEHLKTILMGSSKFKGSILFSGSAGFVESLAYLQKPQKNYQKLINYTHHQVLIVAGSRSKTHFSQVDDLLNETQMNAMKINVRDIFSKEENSRQRYGERAQSLLKSNQDLIILPDPLYSHQREIERMVDQEKMTLRNLEIYIREYLGQLVKEILEERDLQTLILVGGDTAIGVCKALNIQSLNIIDEILPGISLSIPENSNLKIITKAGGFGERNTLRLLIKKIKAMEVKD